MHDDVTTTTTSSPDAGRGRVLLRAEGLTKSFFGTTVLQDAALEVRAGEVHGLVGENGAGKSTLMKLLAGVHQPDSGTLDLGDGPVGFGHPVQAQRAGISTVFQEFNLLPDRTVAENVWLGREPRRGPVVDTRAMVRRTADLLTSLGIEGLAPTAVVRGLSVAEQQIVEIAKAVGQEARIICMDEPTAALADHEVHLLYAIIERLRARGVAIVYVSHRLREIFHLCHTITVLKDGRLVHSGPAAELDDAALVRLMVGRSFASFFPDPAKGTSVGPELLRLEDAGNRYLDGVDLTLHAGEIVGLAGLQGSGRTELLEALFGVHPLTRGALTLRGETRSIRSPRAAIRAGLALVTEDRKATGLALHQSILDNALAVIRAAFPRRTRRARADTPRLLGDLDVKATSLDQPVQFLSGGNQQKVVLARWLATAPSVVLLDEPTRGVDVGAKHAVYVLMRDLAARGVGQLMVSSELPEVIGMADRIIVLRDGQVAGELPGGSTEEDVLALATGSTGDGDAAHGRAASLAGGGVSA